MRPSLGLAGLLLIVAPAVLAQNTDLPDLSTISQPDGQGDQSATTSPPQQTQAETTAEQSTAEQTAQTTLQTSVSDAPESTDAPQTSDAATQSDNSAFPSITQGNGIHLSGLPTLAGVGVPIVQVPNTAAAPFMQKSDLPDGTVFICVGAILAFFGAAVLAWRGMVAWSLHRSVKRAAMAQNLADIKSMSAVPGKKRGMYNVVGANSTMSLDHLSAAPIGTTKPSKPFAKPAGATPPHLSQASLFFSPTAGAAGNAPGNRDSVVNRNSTYLPAGYYAAGNAAPAPGSATYLGGNSLSPSQNRYSRSGISPPDSPALPPSRGTYARAPPSRDGLSMYARDSSTTLGTPGNTRSGVYGQSENVSQLSLSQPGGTNVAGGRAPSAYLEDLFENHGTGARERS